MIGKHFQNENFCKLWISALCGFEHDSSRYCMDSSLSIIAGFIMDPIISTFPKIIYTADVMDALKVTSTHKITLNSFTLPVVLTS